MSIAGINAPARPVDRIPLLAAGVTLCLAATFFASVAIGAVSLSLAWSAP